MESGSVKSGAKVGTNKRQIGRVISAYQSAYPDPLVIRAGEEVTIEEKESEWRSWVWCTSRSGKSGWIPERYVERKREKSIVLHDYEGTELTVNVGEELTVGREESGWIWCTNRKGQSGWVPADHVEKR